LNAFNICQQDVPAIKDFDIPDVKDWASRNRFSAFRMFTKVFLGRSS